MIIFAFALAATLAAASPQTTAPGASADFRTLCVAHPGDGRAALAAADAAGWMVAPDALLKALPPAMAGSKARIRSGASGLEFLVTGVADGAKFTGGGLDLRIQYCALGSSPSDPALSPTVADIAGVPPNRTFEAPSTASIYTYREAPQGHVAVLGGSTSAEFKAAAAAKDLVVLLAQDDGKQSLAFYGIPDR